MLLYRDPMDLFDYETIWINMEEVENLQQT